MPYVFAAERVSGIVMPEVPPHLVVDISSDESESLLTEWRWLIGDDKRVVLVTASGDLFLMDAEDHVLWLETGSGQLTQVASSSLAFHAALQDDSNQREWLLGPVVEGLRASGKVPGPGECYGFCMPAVLGGAYEGDNRVAVSAREHFGFTGYLHGKMRDLPDGTKVKLKWEG